MYFWELAVGTFCAGYLFFFVALPPQAVPLGSPDRMVWLMHEGAMKTPGV